MLAENLSKILSIREMKKQEDEFLHIKINECLLENPDIVVYWNGNGYSEEFSIKEIKMLLEKDFNGLLQKIMNQVSKVNVPMMFSLKIKAMEACSMEKVKWKPNTTDNKIEEILHAHFKEMNKKNSFAPGYKTHVNSVDKTMFIDGLNILFNDLKVYCTFILKRLYRNLVGSVIEYESNYAELIKGLLDERVGEDHFLEQTRKKKL